MISFLVNIIVAVIWLFLAEEQSLTAFFVGWLVGFVILALFGRVIGSETYVRRILALVWFLIAFAREFLISNAQIAAAILSKPNRAIHPNFVRYDVSGMSKTEILLLTHCISLTPGTTTVEIATDFKTILIHCFDVEDPEAVRRQIDTRLKRLILAFTR
jgi:multicomponent Na+:H+ antiporter subunit E